MRYMSVTPASWGELGDDTILDTSVHPPLPLYLQFEFDWYPEDVWVKRFPASIVTEAARQKLIEIGATGIEFGDIDVDVVKSYQFMETRPKGRMPKFVYLKVVGQAGVDDFGTAPKFRFVISQRVFDVFSALGIPNARVEEFK